MNNNKNKHLIGWEEWEDPFSHMSKQTQPTSHDDEFTISQTTTPIIMTPFGLLPISENIYPSKNFKFWIGHTTFRITKQIQDIIEGIDGVEALSIGTPYRMRVAIGKMFVDKNVRENINNALYTYIKEKERIMKQYDTT